MTRIEAMGDNLNLEIEPLRVYRELHPDDDDSAIKTNDAAAELAEVRQLVEERAKVAVAEAGKLLEAITQPSSVER